jgi:hypothetical protein
VYQKMFLANGNLDRHESLWIATNFGIAIRRSLPAVDSTEWDIIAKNKASGLQASDPGGFERGLWQAGNVFSGLGIAINRTH